MPRSPDFRSSVVLARLGRFFPCHCCYPDHNQRDSSEQQQDAAATVFARLQYKGQPMAETALEKLDPADAWQPWQPDDKHSFGLKEAGHLYRRATFGASLPELRQAVKQGFAATLE